MLEAGETILILSFDPSDPLRGDRWAAFQHHYGLTGQERVFGGFDQQLSNRGERVTLLRPDLSLIGQPQQLPQVQEDEVVFHDRLPWPPGADGTGLSLQRMGLQRFGNDPDSWVASDPTPGTLPTVSTPGDFDNNGTLDATDINLLFGQMCRRCARSSIRPHRGRLGELQRSRPTGARSDGDDLRRCGLEWCLRIARFRPDLPGR